MPDLYFNRVPSLPATDDGSARPLTEDLSTGSGDGEDITRDTDKTRTDEVPEEARTKAGPAGEGEFTEADVAFLSASPATDRGSAAGLREVSPGTGEPPSAEATASPDAAASPDATADGSGVDAALEAGETGRWFRPDKKKKYVTIPPEEKSDGAGRHGVATVGEPSGTAAMKDPAEPAADPAASALPGPADEDEDADADGDADGDADADEDEDEDAASADRASQERLDRAETEEPDWTSQDEPARADAKDAIPAVPDPGPAPRPGGTDTQERPNGLGTPRFPDGSGPASRQTGLGWGRREGAVGLAPGLDAPGTDRPELDRPVLSGPVLAPLPVEPGLAPPGGIRRRLSRRTMLQAGLIGGAGVAALPLLALVGGSTQTDEQPTGLAFSMNTNWLFGGQYTSGSESSSFDDSNFAPVTVPHTVVPLSWKDWDYPAWEQLWIYRRHFSGDRLLDPRRPGNRILVDFDGVMVNATVSINDQVAATHQGGYLPFSAEITRSVTSGDNLLSVVVDSRCLPVPPVGVGRGPASVDFFQPGGIYRDVQLRVLPQVFLADLYARPAGVLGSQPRVDIECTLDSAATAHVDGTLLVQLFDGQQQIATQAIGVKADSPGTSTARLSLTGFGPVSLWSPDSPKLYTVQATLNVPGIGSHMLSRRIGFREASFQPDGFFLNGERLQLFGLNRHQLYPYAGMAMGARVQRKDAEILKNEFNCNMVRCSHYPQSPAFLDACDELGLLVWEEAPGWHNVSNIAAWQDAVVRDVRDMVIRDRSRPSVIIWGTRLNEVKNFPGLWAATRQAARELDSTRPSSGAMAFHETATWNEDVFAYNDYGTQDKTGNVALRPPFPGLPYLVTEAVGVEAVKPQHFAWTDPPTWLTHQAAMHGQAHSQARSHPGYAGLVAWAGFDYGSLLGPGPYDIKWAGVADGFRVPKPGAAIYQTQGDPAVRPVIVPVFFWEAAGAVPRSGQTAMIASNCERLDVFIGGTLAASARPATGSPLYGGLAHPPFLVRFPKRLPNPAPDLLIQGFVGGQPVAQVRMSGRPAGDSLLMAVDDAIISADGSDATRAVFRAIDAFGNQRRYGSGQVTLTLSGPAELLGDSPFEFGQYGGLGAVWIRSLAAQPGAITLTASHPLLGQAEVQVRSAPVQHASELA
jgi:beta-galactosidase